MRHTAGLLAWLLSGACLCADYAGSYLAAERLLAQGSNEAAQAAFESLAATAPAPRAQGQCLTMAVQALVRRKHYDEALAQAGAIRDPHMAADSRMAVLLEAGRAPQVIAAYAGEDIGRWPDALIHRGYFRRGRAYSLAGDKPRAASDLTQAVALAGSNAKMKAEALQMLANLAADPAAGLAYRRQILELPGLSDHIVFLEAAFGVADDAIRNQRFEDAEQALQKPSPTLTGYWKFRVLSKQGDLAFARGRHAEAKDWYTQALAIEHPYQPFIEHVRRRLEELP